MFEGSATKKLEIALLRAPSLRISFQARTLQTWTRCPQLQKLRLRDHDGARTQAAEHAAQRNGEGAYLISGNGMVPAKTDNNL